MSAVIQDWTSEPYVLGSYSYPTVGSYPGGLSMRQILAQPVGTALYFAGEATHNNASATVPGALRSGERAAGEHDTAAGGPPAAGIPETDFSASVTFGVPPLDISFTDSLKGPSVHLREKISSPGNRSPGMIFVSAIGQSTRVVNKGNPHREHRFFIYPALHADRPAQQFGKPLRDRQPQPCVSVTCPVIFPVVPQKPGALIPNASAPANSQI